jgi:putative hemolysin
MSAITVEILIIVILIGFNGVLALAEIAIVSSRKTRLQRMASQGSQKAAVALKLAESPADFLSTVQVGITLVGVFSGAFAGATLAEQLAVFLSTYAAVAAYAESIALAVVVVPVTYLSLILGELVPKRIALSNPERVGCTVARPMRFLSRLTSPVVRFLSVSSDVVLWMLRIKPTHDPAVTEEEVRILIRQGAVSGVFEKAEQEMVERVFRLGSLSVQAIMTPRRHIVALSTSDTSELIIDKMRTGGHSHYPLCEGSLDNVLGIVAARDLLLHCLHGRALDLRSCIRDVTSIPESASAFRALELMKQSERHLALVIDEFGGLQGIVTLADFTGAIVGSLPEAEEPRVVERADGSLLVDAMLPIQDLRESGNLPALDVEETRRYSTVGGFVLDRLGRIPSTGDSLAIGDCRIEIVDMDGLRIDKVLITRKTPRESRQ